MGINDKDYADALLEKVQRAYQQQQMEKQMSISGATGLGGQHANTAGLTITNGGAAQNTIGSAWVAQQAVNNAYTTQATIGIKPLREEDLKHDAMQAPLSSLVDMWLMRWDSQWVNEQEFMDDDFWRLALIRLLGANKLEKHNLVNQYHAVYRVLA